MQWDTFVEKAKNASFLFCRDFMEYHQDRFDDFSLMVFKSDELVALLPANLKEKTLYSHQGLTYGGLVLQNDVKFNEVFQIFRSVLEFLNNKEINTLHLKPIPKIYCSHPSDEIDYLMFKLNAQLVRSDLLSVIDTTSVLEITSSNRKRGLQRALKNELLVKEVEDLSDFWEKILIPNLERTHNVKPVHSIEEINRLKSLFPNTIRQFNVYKENTLVAGATIFETKQVAHVQYVSADENKQQYGSLDILFNELINKRFKNKSFFDFGISNENQGQQINKGLLSWKESFGARSIVQNFYSINTAEYSNFDNLML